MNKTDKVIVDAIDQIEIEATRPIEEEVASVDQFSIEALAFWQEYLRRPKGRRAKTYRTSSK